MRCARPVTSCLSTLMFLALLVALHGGRAAAETGACLSPDHAEPAADAGDAADGKDDEGLPLEPERSLPMVLREGTWISLDVSPDGGTVVFDLLGDLYAVPISGGRATPLTSGMAFDGQPRFSPDGTEVVFTSDRSGGENLWILTLGEEEPRQVTKGGKHRFQSPEWTPDGRYLLASRGGLRAEPSKPWLYHVDGGTGVQLVAEPDDIKLMGAAFGDDPRHVWFARRSGRWQYNAQFPQYQLVRYDRQEGTLHVVTSRYGSAFRPTLSPDGRWLVYGTRHDEDTGLRLRDLRTGEERWLAYPVQHDEQEARASRDVLPGMSFTPDSRELVASAFGRIWRFPVDGAPPVEVPFEVEVDLELGPLLDFQYRVDDSPTFTVRHVRDAVPSPDGQHLAFVALDKLWLVDLEGGTPRRVTSQEEHSEHQPAWSPDGRSLAYVTWSAEGGQLRVVRARPGQRGRRLTDVPGTYLEPAWSPDGDRIVALRADARLLQESEGPAWGIHSEADLVWVPARGGRLSRIAPAEGRHRPHFVDSEPDRIWLAHGERGLVSVRFDGSDEREHVKVVGRQNMRTKKPTPASEILASPDGRRVLAQVNWDLFVAELPRAAEPPTIDVSKLDGAIVPARKLTTSGGRFASWSHDSQAVHWSLGRVHFRYYLADAERAEEEAERAREAESRDRPDQDAGDGEDEAEDGPPYAPAEVSLEIEARRDLPRGVLVLSGARIITMNGHEVIEDGAVVVRNDRIAAVGPRGEVSIPEGADVMDLSGTTIVPGFIDTHAHMWASWGVHKRQVWQYLANLAFGVTTTHDPQTGTSDVFSYFDQVESGSMLGPRLYSTGPGVFWTEDVESLDHARDIVRRYSKYHGTHTIKMYVAGNRKQRQWILQACKEQEIRPTTEGALNLKLNLTQILDGYPGHEHNFPNLPIEDDVIELVSRAGTLYTPTLLVTYGGPSAENWYFVTETVHDDPKVRRFVPHSHVDRRALQRQWFHPIRHVFDEHAVFVKDLVEAGGRAGVGSHGQFQGLGYHWELWAMASGGLSPHDALRCATVLAAEGLGLGGDLGTIERGKLADLLVLDDDPLADLRHTLRLRHVMKNGRLHDADTLDEVWPRQVELRRLHWWEDEPAAWTP